MGKLADKMQMDMDLRNLSPRTKSCYLRHMRAFAKHYQASPDGLGEEEIRGYLHHLIVQRNASQATVSQAYSALKFFYMKTLGRHWDAGRLPRSKKARKLPVVLSPQEVAAILQAVSHLKHRTVLTVIYAGGLRVKEAVCLKPEHIDADQMQIRVVQGKGQKDRYTLLGEKALDLLRLYWRVYRPTNFLFYGRDKNAAVSTSTVGKVFRRALANSGVKKQASVHTLRHSFATHLLQDNVDLFYIQRLLGHRSASSTRIYLHVARGDIARLKSPVDRLPEDNMAAFPRAEHGDGARP